MGIGKGKTDYLLSLIREGKQMTLGQQLRLTAYLSVPAIMAQISSIAMQYICLLYTSPSPRDTR